MRLERSRLIMEFGPYGPSGAGGNRSTTGFAVPVGARMMSTWPFVPDPEILMQKEHERQRRRLRLQELALGWYKYGPGMKAAATAAARPMTPAAPGSIF